MKITVDGYPLHGSFTTDLSLPPFEYACPVRTKLVQDWLKRQSYTVQHAAGDFVVEQVTDAKDGETWHLGS